MNFGLSWIGGEGEQGILFCGQKSSTKRWKGVTLDQSPAQNISFQKLIYFIFLGNTLLFLQFAISFFVSSSSGHSSFKRTDIHHHIVKKSSASAVRLSTYFTFPKLL